MLRGLIVKLLSLALLTFLVNGPRVWADDSSAHTPDSHPDSPQGTDAFQPSPGADKPPPRYFKLLRPMALPGSSDNAPADDRVEERVEQRISQPVSAPSHTTQFRFRATELNPRSTSAKARMQRTRRIPSTTPDTVLHKYPREFEFNHRGRVIYDFADQVHDVVCSLNRICDIQLESGEQISGRHLGNAHGWAVTRMVSGPAGYETAHLLVQPDALNLQTSMVITTDRRTYHFELRSSHDEHISTVRFNYPRLGRDIDTASNEQRLVASLDGENLSDRVLDAANLDFKYTVQGDSAFWIPQQVFNDGQRTYIQFAQTLKPQDFPVLMVMSQSDDRRTIKYQRYGRHYVVDTVFNRAILFDENSPQQALTIERESL